MEKGNFFKHWPTMLLGLIVAVVLLTAVFSFQLNQTEVAVVTTFGRPAVVTEPGLHFRWPFPFQKVYRFDKRIRCYEGSSGKLEETVTSDGHNIIVGIYVNYRISDVAKFFSSFKSIPEVESLLNTQMRSAKNAAFGLYNFDQIITYTDGKTASGKVGLDQISANIKKTLSDETGKFGIDLHIGPGAVVIAGQHPALIHRGIIALTGIDTRAGLQGSVFFSLPGGIGVDDLLCSIGIGQDQLCQIGCFCASVKTAYAAPPAVSDHTAQNIFTGFQHPRYIKGGIELPLISLGKAGL